MFKNVSKRVLNRLNVFKSVGYVRVYSCLNVFILPVNPRDSRGVLEGFPSGSLRGCLRISLPRIPQGLSKALEIPTDFLRDA